MAAIRRGLIIFAGVVSAALCVGCAVAGVRTFYHVTKYDYVSRGTWGCMVIPKNGRLDLLVYRRKPDHDVGFTRIRSSPSTIGGTDYSRRVLGFGGEKVPGGVYVNLPFWFLAAVLAVPPAIVVRGELRRRRRRVPGKCHRCGYDLRATPERCPECGATPVSASTSAPA